MTAIPRDLSGNGLGDITGRAKTKSQPGVDAVAVDISATDHLYGRIARAIYVGGQTGTQDLTLILVDGSTLVINNPAAGSIIDIQHKGVDKAGTTTTLMSAIF